MTVPSLLTAQIVASSRLSLVTQATVSTARLTSETINVKKYLDITEQIRDPLLLSSHVPRPV